MTTANLKIFTRHQVKCSRAKSWVRFERLTSIEATTKLDSNAMAEFLHLAR